MKKKDFEEMIERLEKLHCHVPAMLLGDIEKEIDLAVGKERADVVAFMRLRDWDTPFNLSLDIERGKCTGYAAKLSKG